MKRNSFTCKLKKNAERQLNTFEIYLVEDFFRSNFKQNKVGFAEYLLNLWERELIFRSEYDNLIRIALGD